MLPRLRVSGHQLLAGDQPIRLRGINRSGLEYSRRPIPARDLDEIASWGANFIRVPFNQQWLLDGDQYLDQLAAVARQAAARGLYVLFDLHWLAYGQHRGSNPDGSNIATPPLPDADSPRAWQKLAQRFGGDPAVMFDLLNEPHDRLGDDPFPLLSADGTPLHSFRVTARDWQPWAQVLAAAVRRSAPETVLFVSGVDWGFDCSALDLPDVVYAAHVYPYPDRRARADWERAFAGRRPMVVTELGPTDELGVVAELLDFLDERQLGWAAWSFRDAPRLIGDDGAATPFGQLIRSRLR